MKYVALFLVLFLNLVVRINAAPIESEPFPEGNPLADTTNVPRAAGISSKPRHDIDLGAFLIQYTYADTGSSLTNTIPSTINFADLSAGSTIATVGAPSLSFAQFELDRQREGIDDPDARAPIRSGPLVFLIFQVCAALLVLVIWWIRTYMASMAELQRPKLVRPTKTATREKAPSLR